MFDKGSLSAYLDKKMGEVKSDLNSLPLDKLDDAGARHDICARHRIELVALDKSAVRTEVEAVPDDLTALVCHVRIPFEGDPQLLNYRPAATTPLLPCSTADRDTRVVHVDLATTTKNSADEVRERRARQVELLEQWIGSANAQATQWNNLLAAAVEDYARQRREQVGRANELSDDLGRIWQGRRPRADACRWIVRGCSSARLVTWS